MCVPVGVTAAVPRPIPVTAFDPQRREQLSLRELLQRFADGQLHHIGEQVHGALTVGEHGAGFVIQRYTQRLNSAVGIDGDGSRDALGHHAGAHTGCFGEQILDRDRAAARIAQPRRQIPVDRCRDIDQTAVGGDPGEQ